MIEAQHRCGENRSVAITRGRTIPHPDESLIDRASFSHIRPGCKKELANPSARGLETDLARNTPEIAWLAGFVPSPRRSVAEAGVVSPPNRLADSLHQGAVDARQPQRTPRSGAAKREADQGITGVELRGPAEAS
jgi:hypothetical protein